MSQLISLLPEYSVSALSQTVFVTLCFRSPSWTLEIAFDGLGPLSFDPRKWALTVRHLCEEPWVHMVSLLEPAETLQLH